MCKTSSLMTRDPMPEHVVPMAATTGPLPPPSEDDRWAYEIKWDGVRAIAYLRGGELHLESRNLNDITMRYPELTELPAAVGCDAVLDGEVVAFDAQGRPSFQTLQHRMHVANAAEVRRRMVEVPVMYVLFDVLWLDGTTTMALPYTERRQVLEGLGLAGPAWTTPTPHIGGGAALRDATRAQGLEGVMAKRLDSLYEPGRRTRTWIKVKNVGRQEMVIGGWLPGERGREGRLGALVLGHYDETGLRFAGKVGTGFTDKVLEELAGLLAPLARDTSPFVDPVPWRMARFVEPRLVAEVEFTEWTRDGTLRHPSYKGLREDKPATDVRREPFSS